MTQGHATKVRAYSGAPVVDAYSWNPLARYWTRPSTYLRRPNNFGDLIGPLLVRQLAYPGRVRDVRRASGGKLLSVGSVMQFARDGDCVWGTGINGKVAEAVKAGLDLDVRAVRGPLTAAALRRAGYEVPDVYGDPALLLPTVFPGLAELARGPKRIDILVVPNLSDPIRSGQPGELLDPTTDLAQCLRTIATSRLVVGSSLHGVVVAEALGIAARAVGSAEESTVKYRDYYEGTGRANVVIAESVEQAIELGGVQAPAFDSAALLAAFPADLWT